MAYGSFSYGSVSYGGAAGSGPTIGTHPLQVILTQVGHDPVDVTELIQWNSLHLTLVATKEVSTAEFSVTTLASPLPAEGDRVDIYETQDDSTILHLFGGKITERELSVTGGLLAEWAYIATDGSYDFDSQVVVKTYDAMDPGAIVRDLVANFSTGFTVANVDDAGFNMPSIQFNYQPLTKCLQKIATLIGWDWYIDADKDVHFFKAENRLAPFNLTDTNGKLEWPSIDYDISLQNLKNSVFVIGGNYLKAYTALTTPDIYTSVAGTLIYPLGYSYDASTITVKLAGVAQTVGIDQQDSAGSFNVLYNAGANGRGAFLRFTSDPGSGNEIKAYGNAQIPVLGHAFDPGSITAYGERQDAIIDKLITTVSEAQKRAQAEIALYGQPSYTLKFNTLEKGLMMGQTITLNSSLLGISQSFTIKRITGVPFDTTKFRYSVECFATENVSFVDIMTLLLEQELNQNQVDTSTILEVLISVQESMNASDSATITTSVGPYVWGTATWGFSTWNA